MPYLHNEKTRVRAAIQSSESAIAGLTGQIDSQKQVLASMKVQVEEGRRRLAEKTARRPDLEAAAAAEEQRVSNLDLQIEGHQQMEPERVIERPPRPPLPNPEWTTWKRRLDALIAQQRRAADDAAAAHGRLDQLNSEIAQATAELHGVEARFSEGAATRDRLEQSLIAEGNHLLAAHQSLADLIHASDEVDRHPIDRAALEQVAASLSVRVLELEDAYAVASAASRAADATLSTLISRHDQLTASIADINSQLPAANEAVSVADAAVAELAQQLDELMSGQL